jgi:hypothetical protein
MEERFVTPLPPFVVGFIYSTQSNQHPEPQVLVQNVLAGAKVTVSVTFHGTTTAVAVSDATLSPSAQAERRFAHRRL